MFTLGKHLTLAACLALLMGDLAQGQSPKAGEKHLPPEVNAARTDLFGDPLPAGALSRLGTTRLRRAGVLSSVAFSPDGKVLASGSSHNAVILRDAATGQELRRFLGHRGDVHAVAFAPDGKLLASGGSDGTVRLWDVRLGKELHQLRGHKAAVTLVTFSPDGKTLASGGADQPIRIWEAATGKELCQLQQTHRSIAFSPDGKVLAWADEAATIHLWELATGKELRKIESRPGISLSSKDSELRQFVAFAFSPDGKTLASGGAHRVRFWEAATGKELPAEPTDWSAYSSFAVAFSPDGKTLAFDHGYTIRLREAATGKELARLEGYHHGLTFITFSPDGKVLAAVCNDQTIRLWSTATGHELRRLKEHEGVFTSIVLSPDGKTLATWDTHRTVRLWDVATGKDLLTIQELAFHIAFSPDGKILATAPYDYHTRPIHMWEVATGKKLGAIKVPIEVDTRGLFAPPSISAIAFSPDGKTLASGAMDGIRLWEATTGKQLRHIDHREWVLALTYSPDGKTLAAKCRDGTIRLLETATGKERRRIRGAEETIYPVAFSADGKTLVSTSMMSSTIRLWEVATGQERHQLKGDNQVAAFAFSPDGKILASEGEEENTIRLRAIATGRELRPLQGHQGRVTALAFSRDGRRLVSGSMDTTALVWDVASLDMGETPPQAKLSPQDLEALWGDLKGEDAPRAYRAIQTLAAAPRQAVPFLHERLRPAPAVDQRRLARLLADLDSEQFVVRKRATEELEKLEELAEPALRQALENQPTLEVRQRVELLLEKLEETPLSPERLRALRAVEMLEQSGATEARQLLRALAHGAPEARLTRDAQAALGRLARPNVTMP